MDTPLLTDRASKPKPRAESIFRLKAVKELGEPKVIKEEDIFQRPGAKPKARPQPRPKAAKRDRYAPPRPREPPKRMRKQQGATYRRTD